MKRVFKSWHKILMAAVIMLSVTVTPKTSQASMTEYALLSALLTVVANSATTAVTCNLIENIADNTDTSTIVSCFQEYNGCQSYYIFASNYYLQNCQ